MRKFMMKYMMVNCKESTLLTAKNEEGKLSLIKKMQLFMHTAMCSFCNKFEKQAAKIGKESRNIQADGNLSDTTKERIQKAISDQ